MEIIGEITLKNESSLLKMWTVDVKPGPRTFMRHSHTRFEITVVNGGSGEYTTEKAVYPMEPGDVFVFPSNAVHCITFCGEKGLSITNLHFEPRFLQEREFMNFCFSHAPDFSYRIAADEAGEIRRNHEKIKEEFLQGGPMHPMAVKSYLHLILIDLLRNRQYGAPDKQEHLPDLRCVYDYIEEHLSEEMTLGSLAALVNLSPNYFSHLFKKLGGITLWEYITAKRVEQAARLICSDREHLTMLDIALRCGFNNTVNFNKAFKKRKGITPSQLKKDPKLLYTLMEV